MFLAKRFDRLFRRQRTTDRSCTDAKRLWLEPLEDRRMLSGFTPGPLVQVSGDSPLADCHDQLGDAPEQLNVEREPWLAVNPTNGSNLVGMWMQDGVRGHVAGLSFNGGNTWQSVVIPGVSICTGGTAERISDPWLAFTPNGDLFATTLTFTPADGSSAIVVNKSSDGGLTWSNPTVIIEDEGVFFNDKESITADPEDPNLVYVTWTRLGNQGTTWFSRTTDGGQTWEPARKIFDSKGWDVEGGHQILVLPDGTLVNIFQRYQWKNGAGGVGHYETDLALIRSPDKGETWEGPIKVSDVFGVTDTRRQAYARDPDTGERIRAVSLPDVAVDPNSGTLYTVWEDARFSDFQHPSIALALSKDGGMTWSDPIQVNQTPTDLPSGSQQALHASVHVNAEGTVGVTYYDFRFNTPEVGVPTDYWFVHADAWADASDPANWHDELRLTNKSFNLEDSIYVSAPGVQNGYMIGDYEGLASDGRDFLALFTQADSFDHGSTFFRRVRATSQPLASGANAASGDIDFQTADAWYAAFYEDRVLQSEGLPLRTAVDLIDIALFEMAEPVSLTVFDQLETSFARKTGPGAFVHNGELVNLLVSLEDWLDQFTETPT